MHCLKNGFTAADFLEDALARWRVTVLHKFHMHEKLVFIDEDIAPSVSQSSPTPAGGRLAQS